MELYEWKTPLWIEQPSYPKGMQKNIIFLLLIFLGVLLIIFCFPYTVYQTYYGIVEEESMVKIPVLLEQMEEFQYAVKEDNRIHLVSVEPEVQIEANQNFVFVHITISMSKKQFVKNNIIPIKLKIKRVSFWEELYQKWTKGMKL